MTASGLRGLRIGLIGPLPPPSGGMANQTRQLAELLNAAGATVTTVQVNAPYWPQWITKIPGVRSVFRLVPYMATLWLVAGRTDVFHVMANSGWSGHLFAAPSIWIARIRRVAVVVNYRGGEAYLHDSETVTADYTVPSHISLRANPFATGFEKAYPGDWIIIRVTGHFEIWSDEEFTKFFEAV